MTDQLRKCNVLAIAQTFTKRRCWEKKITCFAGSAADKRRTGFFVLPGLRQALVDIRETNY